LWNAATIIFGLGRACLPPLAISFFYGTFQPHHDEMQHAPIDDTARYRFQ
jgi:hypothetical protein